MQQLDNPYVELVNTMRKEGARNNPPSMGVGVVKTVSPLTISVNDLTLYEDDVYISDMLLDNYTRHGVITGNATGSETGSLNSETQNTSGGSGDSSFASHNHAISNSYSSSTNYNNFTGEFDITIETCLKVGDLVALIPVNTMSRYIVLCKVVALA